MKKLGYWLGALGAVLLFVPSLLPEQWQVTQIIRWAWYLLAMCGMLATYLLWQSNALQKMQIRNLERALLTRDLQDKAEVLWTTNGQEIDFGGGQRQLFTVYNVRLAGRETKLEKLRSFFGSDYQSGTMFITDQKVHVMTHDDMISWDWDGLQFKSQDIFGIEVLIEVDGQSYSVFGNGHVGLTPGLCMEISHELIHNGEAAAAAHCHKFANLLMAHETVKWS